MLLQPLAALEDDQWHAYASLCLAIEERFRNRRRSLDVDGFRRGRLEMVRIFERREAVLFDGPRAIAWISWYPEDGALVLRYDALLDPIPDAVFRALAAPAFAQARHEGRDHVVVQAEDTRCAASARAAGGKELNRYLYAELATEHLDTAAAASAVSRSRSRHPELQLTRHENYDGGTLLEAYVVFVRELLEDLPRTDGGEAYEPATVSQLRDLLPGMIERGATTLTVLLSTEEGEVVGLCEAVVDSREPERAAQKFTGVRAGWRGHGHGGWLKHALHLWLLERCEGLLKVETMTHADNLHMAGLNRSLGFVVVREAFEVAVPVSAEQADG